MVTTMRAALYLSLAVCMTAGGAQHGCNQTVAVRGNQRKSHRSFRWCDRGRHSHDPKQTDQHSALCDNREYGTVHVQITDEGHGFSMPAGPHDQEVAFSTGVGTGMRQ